MRRLRKSGASATKPEIAAVLSTALLFAACAHAPAGPPPEAKIETQDVNLAVAASCVPDGVVDAKPTYKDTAAALKAAPDMAARDALVKGEWARHQVREAELEALIRGCWAPLVPR